MKRILFYSLLLMVILVLVGCMAHEFTVGNGPQKGIKVEKRQWYALWGLVPINKVDLKEIVGDETNYSVRTAQEPLDFIFSMVTGSVTVYSRTVTVTK